jgi:hypothetical protein
MKLFRCFVVVLTALAFAPILSAQRVITCSSDNGRRNFCAADTRDGVLLVNQRSGSPCNFGQTWGFDRKGVWVDRGCRAEFQVGSQNTAWPGYDSNRSGYNIYCASDDGRRNECPTDTRGGVSMIRQRSGSPCAYGSTWGYNRNGIWVDRGCRADFQVRSSSWNPGGGYPGGGYPGGGYPGGGSPGGGYPGGGYPGGGYPGGGSKIITCSSDDMRRQTCNVNTQGSVRLIRQMSEADCVRGQTWGYTSNSIWVDRGCRAEFEVGNFR